MIRNLLKRFAAARTPEEKARKQLFSITLRKSDIAIDCGANVGEVTQQLSKSGATVYCFEPNPYAYEVLQKRFANAQNVHCIPKGVGDTDSMMKLYLHENSDSDEVQWSTGSSLLDFKGNVRTDKYVDVEIVDLCRFIDSLEQRVKILKMDVEGVECAILKKIITSGIIDRIDYAFVETHDHKIPEIKAETDELRALVREKGLTKVNLDWT